MVRVERRFDRAEDETFEHLTLDRTFPVFLADELFRPFILRHHDELYGESARGTVLPGCASDFEIVRFDIGEALEDPPGKAPSMRRHVVGFYVRPDIAWRLAGRQAKGACAVEQFFGPEARSRHSDLVGQFNVAMLGKIDFDQDDLPGTILASTWNGEGMPAFGILETVERDGKCYALLTTDLANMKFARLRKTAKADPWSGTKVASTTVWFDVGRDIGLPAFNGAFDALPRGWAFAEVSGGRASFVVEGEPDAEDGVAVLAMLQRATGA